MFKRFKRKLASAAHKRPQRNTVYDVSPRPGFETSSDGSPRPDTCKRILSQERGSPPQPGIGAWPDARVKTKKLAKPEDVCHFKLDNDDGESPSLEIGPPPGPKDEEISSPQCPIRAQSNSNQQEVEDSLIKDEAAKLITLRTPSRKLRALLLPPCTFQRTQALVHARQDLRAVESELATTSAELRNLIAAKSELEELDDSEVPGAFFDDDAYAEKERRRLLMATLERKIGLCEQDLEDLESRRPRLEADLEALQEKFLDDFERAVRDDVAAKASVSKVGDSGKSCVWWTG
jgi:chaperonin cofactor prefoldin